MVRFDQVDHVMVTVSDMDRSVAFYRDAVGLTLAFASPDWSEFRTGSTTLALHGGGRPGPPGDGQRAGVASLGFSVVDLEQAVAELSARGVRFVMPPKRQEAEGIALAVAVDPDGLAISFVQRLGAGAQ